MRFTKIRMEDDFIEVEFSEIEIEKMAEEVAIDLMFNPRLDPIWEGCDGI